VLYRVRYVKSIIRSNTVLIAMMVWYSNICGKNIAAIVLGVANQSECFTLKLVEILVSVHEFSS
jgi:hypothetical protein